jgi:hypothetical protein
MTSAGVNGFKEIHGTEAKGTANPTIQRISYLLPKHVAQ